MGLKKIKRKGEPDKKPASQKEEQKKVPSSIKEEKEKQENVEEVLEVLKEKLPEKQPELILPDKQKKDFSGVGVVGKHIQLNKFRSTCRFHGKSMGEEILKMMEEWNAKHTIDKW